MNFADLSSKSSIGKKPLAGFVNDWATAHSRAAAPAIEPPVTVFQVQLPSLARWRFGSRVAPKTPTFWGEQTEN
jgi:hypothetical protein